MKKITLLLMIGLVFGCGSRKVNKNKHSLVEENQTSITDQTSTKEIEFDRKHIWELIYKLNFKADNITIHPDGTIDISQPMINSESKETNQEELKERISEKENITTLDEKSNRNEHSEQKNSDRKPFNWGLLLIPIFFIITLIYLIIRFLKKQKSRLL